MILQVVQQDLAFSEAVTGRFKPGSALGQARASAEEGYAEALANIAERYNNSQASAMAAESYMNLSPWDYYKQVIHLSLHDMVTHILSNTCTYYQVVCMVQT